MAYKFKPFSAMYMYSMNNAEVTRDILVDNLSQSIFSPCGANDLSRRGWLSRNGKLFVLGDDNHLMVVYCCEYKDIPRDVVSRRMSEEVRIWKQRTGYKRINMQARKELKRKIYAEETSKAYTKYVYMPVWFNLEKQLLIIDAKKADKAEEVIFLLREDFNSFPVVPIVTKTNLSRVVAEWLTGEMPPEIDTKKSIELVNEQSIIKYKDVAITKEVANRIVREQYQVNKIGLEWNDKIRFQLSDNLCFTEILFNRGVLMTVRDMPMDQREDARFLSQARVVGDFIDNMSGLMNGYQ